MKEVELLCAKACVEVNTFWAAVTIYLRPVLVRRSSITIQTLPKKCLREVLSCFERSPSFLNVIVLVRVIKKEVLTKNLTLHLLIQGYLGRNFLFAAGVKYLPYDSSTQCTIVHISAALGSVRQSKKVHENPR